MPNDTVHLVADYFLYLARHEDPDEAGFLSSLQLQKLLYFAQGWALAEWHNPLFKNRIEAWQHGPVVREVWERFRESGDRPITFDQSKEPELSSQEKALVDDVWDYYKKYAPWTLSDIAHREEPWLKARGDTPDDSASTKPIDTELMKRTFAHKLKKQFEHLSGRAEDLLSKATANTNRLFGKPSLE